MLRKRNIIFAGLCAALVWGAGFNIPVFAAEIPTVTVESDALADATETQITGEIVITVYDNPVSVIIEKYTLEGLFIFYNTEIAPQEGTSATEYLFPLTYSQILRESDTTDNTYKADYLDYVYTSSYTLTISDPETEGAVYEEENILIGNSHEETRVTGTTRYEYDVQFSRETDYTVSSVAHGAVLQNGNALLERTILFKSPFELGDVNGNWHIDISDASLVLSYYSRFASGLSTGDLNMNVADIDENGILDVRDAYYILAFYAAAASGSPRSFDDIIG